jgi:hypothetical protein
VKVGVFNCGEGPDELAKKLRLPKRQRIRNKNPAIHVANRPKTGAVIAADMAGATPKSRKNWSGPS